jgi:putative heme-binding domain-containing protein
MASLRCSALAALVLFAATALPAQTPEWIWHANDGQAPGDGETRFFRKRFSLPGAPRKAQLTVAADNQFIVLLNGREVARGEGWSEPQVFDLTRQLKPEENCLAVQGRNEGGPAGVLVRLEVTQRDGGTQAIVSDTSWLVSAKNVPGWEKPNFNDADWTRAKSLGKAGVQPWGDVLAKAAGKPRAPAAPRVATPADRIDTLPGFKVELIRNAEPGEGSWVCLAADAKGRLIISPQGKEPILRATLGADGKIAKLETIDLPVSGAMGLLYAFDSLYVNGQGPDGYHLYRLRDTDGDHQYDKVELLRKWKGGPGEHGAHGIVLGADKKLYIVCGNFVDVPEDILPTSPHRNYADDQVLPRAEDGNGFGAGRKPPGGYVVRLDPDGRNAELFASGQRNTYDIAFNADGELFGFDSDMEWDWGTPWYRPTRVHHIVSGADHGFREGTAKWPEHYEDSLPATANIGIGSPTGVRSGAGAKFPPKYQRALYVLDWTYGRILAVHLKPNGASYTSEFENFVAPKNLRGGGEKSTLNVTDLEIGPDGAMYFATGGRGTQSGLYRVSHAGVTSPEGVAPDSTAAAARQLRRKLDAFHGRQDPEAIETAWPHLDSADRFIRYAARIAIESQPVEQWQQRALDERRTTAALTALLALARVGSDTVQEKLFESLGDVWDQCHEEWQKLAGLRVAQVAFARMGRPSQDVAEGTIRELDRVYPTRSAALNRELCQLLIYLNAPGVAQKTLGLLAKAETQEEQIHYVFHLRHAKEGWTLDERRQYFGWFNRERKVEEGGPTYPGGSGYFIRRSDKHPPEAVKWFTDVGREYGDGASFPKFMANIRKAAADSLTEAERTELAPLLTATAAAPTKPVKPRQLVKEWTMADLVPVLDDVGRGRNFARGQEAFAAAQCLACHRFGREGGASGPDITAVSSRFTRLDLLSSILEPSKVVSEQYQNITVTTKDGDDVTGRLLEENNAKLVLLVDPLTGRQAEVKKGDVSGRVPSKLSAMPEGLVNVLTKEEFLDLLAYIESGGKKEHAAFKTQANP